MQSRSILLCAIACFCALIFVAQAAPLGSELAMSGYTFDQYIQEYKKSYFLSNDLQELEKRREIFNTNLASIIAHNSQGHPWTQGVNEFTDMTDEEFLSLYTGYTGRPSIAKLQAAEAEDPNTLVAALEHPEFVDWSARGTMARRIRNQGKCGSCYSFAAVATLEYYLYATTGQNNLELSTQQSVDCLENKRECGGTGGCHGFTADAVFRYAEEHGLTSEALYPYYSGETKEAGECKLNDDIPMIIKAHDVVQMPVNDPNAIMSHLSTYGPLAVSVDATKWKKYEGGILTECARSEEPVPQYDLLESTTNHAVVLVGYGVDPETGLSYWKIRNSWGPAWGQKGHILILRAGSGEPEQTYINMNPQTGSACKDDPTDPFVVAGSCGVLSDAWAVKSVTRV